MNRHDTINEQPYIDCELTVSEHRKLELLNDAAWEDITDMKAASELAHGGDTYVVAGKLIAMIAEHQQSEKNLPAVPSYLHKAIRDEARGRLVGELINYIDGLIAP